MTPPASKQTKAASSTSNEDPDFERETPAPTQTRLSVNVNPSTAAAIREYTDLKGVTTTEAVRRLIAYGNVVFQADREGKKILLKDGDEIERLLIVD